MLDCRGKQLVVGKRCCSSCRSGRPRGVGWGRSMASQKFIGATHRRRQINSDHSFI